MPTTISSCPKSPTDSCFRQGSAKQVFVSKLESQHFPASGRRLILLHYEFYRTKSCSYPRMCFLSAPTLEGGLDGPCSPEATVTAKAEGGRKQKRLPLLPPEASTQQSPSCRAWCWMLDMFLPGSSNLCEAPRKLMAKPLGHSAEPQRSGQSPNDEQPMAKEARAGPA